MGHNGPHNIGTHPEDVPRSLDADMGGEGSPTDRLWMRYRTELARRPSRAHGDGSQRRHDMVDGLNAHSSHGLWTLLRRLVGAPA